MQNTLVRARTGSNIRDVSKSWRRARPSPVLQHLTTKSKKMTQFKQEENFATGATVGSGIALFFTIVLWTLWGRSGNPDWTTPAMLFRTITAGGLLLLSISTLLIARRTHNLHLAGRRRHTSVWQRQIRPALWAVCFVGIGLSFLFPTNESLFDVIFIGGSGLAIFFLGKIIFR